MQEGLLQAGSPYNLVRIILGKKREPQDRPATMPIDGPASTFSATGAAKAFFVQDYPTLDLPLCSAFYRSGSKAELERMASSRSGRIEALPRRRLPPRTDASRPKADRLELLRATRAHFGQIFMLYSDPAGEIDSLLNPNGAPDIETIDEYDVSHEVWKIPMPGVIELGAATARQKADYCRRPPSLRNCHRLPR